MMRAWIVGMVAASLCGCAAHTSKEVAAQRALGRELVRRGDWAGAFAVVQPLCKDHPDDAEALMLRGMIYTEQKLLTEAEADLLESVGLDPRRARAHSALAIVYDMQGRAPDAQKHHRAAVELEPKDPGLLNNLGFSLFASGRPRDAIPVLHEALRAAPMDSRIRNNLGFAYAASGDLTRAFEQFSLAGSAAQAKNNLGWAYERRGALPQAFDLYAEAVKADPAFGEARTNLSRVARALSRELPPDLQAPSHGS